MGEDCVTGNIYLCENGLITATHKEYIYIMKNLKFYTYTHTYTHTYIHILKSN